MAGHATTATCNLLSTTIAAAETTTRGRGLALSHHLPQARIRVVSCALRHRFISTSAATLSTSVLLLSTLKLGPVLFGFGRGPRPQSQSQSQLYQTSGVAMASSDAAASIPKIQKSEEEWRTILSPEQFRILRKKGTEFANTGEYNKFKKEGTYECAACGTPLYKSTTKFDSGCGWPAFYEGLPGAITETPDPDGRRVEITCTACGGHLGHNFRGEGFSTPTNERHCVNSISLKFTPPKK